LVLGSIIKQYFNANSPEYQQLHTRRRRVLRGFWLDIRRFCAMLIVGVKLLHEESLSQRGALYEMRRDTFLLSPHHISSIRSLNCDASPKRQLRCFAKKAGRSCRVSYGKIVCHSEARPFGVFSGKKKDLAKQQARINQGQS
jgi:hypothetical protein